MMKKRKQINRTAKNHTYSRARTRIIDVNALQSDTHLFRRRREHVKTMRKNKQHNDETTSSIIKKKTRLSRWWRSWSACALTGYWRHRVRKARPRRHLVDGRANFANADFRRRVNYCGKITQTGSRSCDLSDGWTECVGARTHGFDWPLWRRVRK